MVDYKHFRQNLNTLFSAFINAKIVEKIDLSIEFFQNNPQKIFFEFRQATIGTQRLYTKISALQIICLYKLHFPYKPLHLHL